MLNGLECLILEIATGFQHGPSLVIPWMHVVDEEDCFAWAAVKDAEGCFDTGEQLCQAYWQTLVCSHMRYLPKTDDTAAQRQRWR